MCATHGGFWPHWKSSAESTGLIKPSCASSFWPVRMRRREVSLIDQETWWAVKHSSCIFYFFAWLRLSLTVTKLFRRWTLSTHCSELQVSPCSETKQSSRWILCCACRRTSCRESACSRSSWASRLTYTVTYSSPHTHTHTHIHTLSNSPPRPPRLDVRSRERTTTHISVSWSLQTHFKSQRLITAQWQFRGQMEPRSSGRIPLSRSVLFPQPLILLSSLFCWFGFSKIELEQWNHCC